MKDIWYTAVLLLSQIKLSGLNIILIAFHAHIIPFKLQLGWCALIQKMRHNFEAAEITLMEVEIYKRDQKLSSGPCTQANISVVDLSGGRGSSGIDIR